MVLTFFTFVLTSLITVQGLLHGPGVYQLTEPIGHTECPHWDIRNNVLYFVNIPTGTIFRYDFTTDVMTNISLHGNIAPVIPSKNDPNLLYAGLDRSVVAVEWDGHSEHSDVRNLTTVSEDVPISKFNDGKADKNGRLWIGTMNDGSASDQGVLYEVTCENLNSPQVEVAPVNTSNGIAFNKANDRFYYIDSPTKCVAGFDYNETDGSISNRQVVFNLTYHDFLTGDPDGMTIDEDDNLWVALFGGGAVIKVDPLTGDLLQVVALPAMDVSSAMWGGPDLDILFITTSREYLTDEQKLEQPAAGSVFAIVDLGTKGLPANGVEILESITDESCGTDKGN